MRRDAWPVIGALTALVALVAVSWRASPDRHDVELILYVIGGALEAVGALTIGLDLQARRKRARRFRAMTQLQSTGATWNRQPRTFLATGMTIGSRHRRAEEQLATLERRMTEENRAIRREIDDRLRHLERDIQDRITAASTFARRSQSQLAGLFGAQESDAVAWAGFGALLLGVLVGTAANILSATA